MPEETVFGSMPWHDVEVRGIPQLREVVDVFYSEAVNEDLSPVIPFPALCESCWKRKLFTREKDSSVTALMKKGIYRRNIPYSLRFLPS
ncbi:MAG TPA: hypothetical protein VIK78_05960 [Ruminiclostridium sp.]